MTPAPALDTPLLAALAARAARKAQDTEGETEGDTAGDMPGETAGDAPEAVLGGIAGKHADAEWCELCAEPLPRGHRHLLDLAAGELLCACTACTVLFDDQGAGGRHYRLVPRERRPLPGFRLDGTLWAGLGVPVDLAFFVLAGDGAVAARYPSPAGALRADVHPVSWRRVTDANPVLAELRPEVEALVVHRARDAAEHWILPLDDCYRLTALLREHWTGFGGGDAVWARIAGFFDEMRGKP
ncbi:DUF5947 family protein [Actinomadura roseirufa]|uniref:DUF5947 family protein n=1 Tax=Actinomadura roseirufa TaxID=2094049 RepID=UPI001F5F24B3|nr:DUF5947 family protein [Actinomadura roseirufa]